MKSEQTTEESLDEVTLDKIRTLYDTGNQLDQTAFYSATSALIKRIDEFGGERAILGYDSPSLAQCLLLTNGESSTLISMTYIQALLEGNGELCRLLSHSQHVKDLHALVLALENSDETTALDIIASTEDAIHLSLARYVALPTIVTHANSSWLSDLANVHRPITHALLKRLLILRGDLYADIQVFLAQNLDILTIGDPDELLAPLVANSHKSPEVILEPFSGIYGHKTLIQGAIWHLERKSYKHVHALLEQVPVLHTSHDHALLIRSIAYMEDNMDSSAQSKAQHIMEPALQRQWRMRWGEKYPNLENCESLQQDALDCTQDEPETLYRILLILLKNGLLHECKNITHAHKDTFNHINEIKQIFQVIDSQ